MWKEFLGIRQNFVWKLFFNWSTILERKTHQHDSFRIAKKWKESFWHININGNLVVSFLCKMTKINFWPYAVWPMKNISIKKNLHLLSVKIMAFVNEGCVYSPSRYWNWAFKPFKNVGCWGQKAERYFKRLD